jgi:hypothetical protein
MSLISLLYLEFTYIGVCITIPLYVPLPMVYAHIIKKNEFSHHGIVMPH